MPDSTSTPPSSDSDSDSEPPDHVRALTDCFYSWELRGRGWQLWDYAVALEPPYRPIIFPGADALFMDAQRRKEPFGGLAEPSRRFASLASPSVSPAWHEPWAEPAPAETLFKHRALDIVPRSTGSAMSVRSLIQLAGVPQQVFAVEAVSNGGNVRRQVTFSETDDPAIEEFLGVRRLTPAPCSDRMQSLAAVRDGHFAAIELGLAREFLLALPSGGSDPSPSRSALAAMAGLSSGEHGALQILMKSAHENWAQEMLNAALGPTGDGLFDDSDRFVALCREKIAEPLFAVLVRAVGVSGNPARANQIANDIAQAFCRPYGAAANRLIVLPAPPASFQIGIKEIIVRRSRRCGMILNAAELAALASLDIPPSRPNDTAMRFAAAGEGALLGEEVAGRRRAPFRLSTSDRFGHMEIATDQNWLNANLFVELILHDLEERNGVALIDPDGAVADMVLRRLPRHRLAHIAVIDPNRAPVAIDLLSAPTRPEQIVLGAHLLAAFRRGANGWSGETTSILANALAALWQTKRTAGLLDLRNFLNNETVREDWLQDGSGARYWREIFPKLGAAAVAPLLSQLDIVLGDDGTRAVLTGAGLHFDFVQLLRGGILLACFPTSVVGRAASEIASSLVLAKLHQAFLALGAASEFERPPFFCYVNEAHRLALPALAKLYASARRARAGLVLSDGSPRDRPKKAGFGRSQLLVEKGAQSGHIKLHSATAVTQINVPPLPVEPPDAVQRLQDALIVSTRRFGLATRESPRRSTAPATARIPHLLITPS